jgi:hypothetical protein
MAATDRDRGGVHRRDGRRRGGGVAAGKRALACSHTS